MNPQQSFSMNRPIFLVTLFLHILFKIARVFSCNKKNLRRNGEGFGATRKRISVG